jgi:dTDP-4-dehydrorhamnose 3,5-epimerase
MAGPSEPVCLSARIFRDARGSFTKTWHPDLLATCGISMAIAEEFYSVSDEGVIRGMHFQRPPHDHEKLVYCAAGKLLDVVVDLRRSGRTYGQVWSWELSPENGNIIYIPKGFAHGFLSLSPGTVTVYKTSTVHAPTHDDGVRWDSLGFRWPVHTPILSDRDRKHPTLTEYVSPF